MNTAIVWLLISFHGGNLNKHEVFKTKQECNRAILLLPEGKGICTPTRMPVKLDKTKYWQSQSSQSRNF